MNIDLYIGGNCFLFRRGAKEVGRAPLATLELTTDKSATPDEVRDMRYYVEDFVPGEIMTMKPAAGVVLGPARDFTHEVTLRAYGNPDFSQYTDIGRKKTVKVCGIEEARQAVRDYQARYDMGRGNCGPDHGKVWETPAGKKRKLAGYVGYGGHYETVAERKKWEAEMAAKYPKSA